MYILKITCTGKGYHPSAQWTQFHHDELHGLENMQAVYDALKERYGNAKRAPMYRDRKDGASYKCGWIIGFRNADYSHAPVSHWLQQDWIELIEYNAVDLAA